MWAGVRATTKRGLTKLKLLKLFKRTVVSMSKQPERVPPCSPMLRRIVDSYRSELSPEGFVQAELDTLSVCDYGIMEDSWFVSNGSGIIAKSKEIATRAGVASINQGSSSSNDAVYNPASKFVENPSDFKIPAHKKSKFDLNLDLDVDKDLSGRDKAKGDLTEVANTLFARMSTVARERFMPGLHRVPAEVAQKMLVTSLSGWGVGTLRSALSALNRLEAWLGSKFGSGIPHKVEPALVGWFLMNNLVADDEDGHTSMSLVSGLRFLADSLKYPIEVQDASVKALSRGPRKTPKQAPSASVRVAFHFWSVAMDASHSVPLRAMSGAFLIKCLCGLRSIDAQRSSFDKMTADSGNGWRHFSAVAWDSKSKTSMPWACPLITFGSSSDWFEPLRSVWGENDFMFPSSPKGAKLAGMSSMVNSPASAYMVLKYLREILMLPSLSLSATDAARLRRHSFRHWIANLLRILRKPPSDIFQGGRWKEHGCMPLRYAEETKFLSQIRIIADVCKDCEAALEKVGVKNWPVFGGWELLMEDRTFDGGLRPEVSLTVEPELGVDLNGGSDDEDSSDDEQEEVHDNFARQPPLSPSKPYSKKILPRGWEVRIHTLSSGRLIKHYYGPEGARARSIVGAWRIFDASADFQSAGASLPQLYAMLPPSAATNTCPVRVGQAISIFWTGDKVWYRATVQSIAVDGSACASVRYGVDGEVCVHDFDDVQWEPVEASATDRIRRLQKSSADALAALRRA